MSKELVISSNRHETRVAILEDDQLVEVYFQRSNEYSLAGSIHKGRVTRVLPGMQSAFVDLGLERDTFLYVSDFFEENEEYDKISGPAEERPARNGGGFTRRDGRTERPPQGYVKPIEQIVEAVEAPVTAVEPPAAASQQRQERSEGGSGDARDRGRRSRRRRSRGGGFPDSKYASDVDSPAVEAPAMEAAAPERERERSPIQEEPEPRDVILLPGESLAKYSRPARNVAPEPVATIIGASPVVDAFLEAIIEAQPEVEPAETPASVDPIREEPAPPEPVSAVPEPVVVSGFPDSSFFAPPVVESGFGSGAAMAREPEPQLESEPVVAHTTTGAEAAAEALDPRHEADAEAAMEEALELVAAEAAEEAADVADHVEAGNEPNEDTEVEAVGEPGAEPAVATEASDKPQTASVREPGTRYMHRGPRGARRKRRGGDRGGDRTNDRGESRGEGRGDRPESRNEPKVEGVDVAPAPQAQESQRSVARPDRERPPLPSITELLKEGQEIIVQIAKEPIGQKGARITSHIALPGRYVVYMPSLEHLGVSRKIESDEERLRLKRILQANHTGITGGYIVRTAGEGKTEEEIAADMQFLYNLWLDIRQKAEKKPAPLLLHHDLEIVQRILRDQLTDTFKSIWVDNEELYESVLRFMQRFQPALVSRVKMYTRPTPIFDAFNVTNELEKALRPKVWLKSGGYIVINQTEALVAIDINTGKYVGKSNRLEDTIVKTNTEAVKEIVRQIRLRDLGGIIVVDFIDMDERKNRQKVMQALEEAMREDRAPYKILQFNDFGLVAITRKRVKQSLERTLCAPCPTCEGAGYVKSVQTVVNEILLEAYKIRNAVEGKDCMLRANPEVAKFIKSNTNKYLEELEEILGRPVLVTSDPALHQEKFDLA
jgi:ribonuclease G